jgi:nicotinamide-nucleotide adenylyltransferase
MKKGLFVGRFQPFHLGHLQDIKNALEEVGELYIAIGSSNEENTKENPFSSEERTDMIRLALKGNRIDKYTIYTIPDFGNDEKWVGYIKTALPKFDVVFTGNEWTERCFKKFGYNIKKVKIVEDVSSTIIRDKIIKNEDWQSMVPKEVVEYISEINGVERVKKTK